MIPDEKLMQQSSCVSKISVGGKAIVCRAVRHKCSTTDCNGR